MACDDERAVTWVKKFVTKLDNGIGAWLSHEGPNLHALQCMVPHPTGQFSANEILEQVKKTHEFQGNYKTGLFMRFAIEGEFLKDLQTVGFKLYCLITRLNIFNSRDQARNKEKSNDASLKPSTVKEDTIMEKVSPDPEMPSRHPSLTLCPPTLAAGARRSKSKKLCKQ